MKMPQSEAPNIPLNSEQFQEALNDVAYCLNRNGWVLIFRNTMPTALLDPNRICNKAKATHFGDDEIRTYVNGLKDRAKLLRKNAKRVILVFPKRIGSWFCSEPDEIPWRPETTGGKGPDLAERVEIWKDFHEYIGERSMHCASLNHYWKSYLIK